MYAVRRYRKHAFICKDDLLDLLAGVGAKAGVFLELMAVEGHDTALGVSLSHLLHTTASIIHIHCLSIAALDVDLWLLR